MGWKLRGKNSRSSSSGSSNSSTNESQKESDAGSVSGETDDGKAHIEVCARIRPIAVKAERQGFFDNKTASSSSAASPIPSGLKPPTSSRLKAPSSKPSFFKRVTRKAPLPTKSGTVTDAVSSLPSPVDGDFVAWEVNEEGDTATQSKNTNLIQGRTHNYTLDRVYGTDATTRDIYDNTIRKLVKDAMEGYHSSILSYGQTSTGKTFTMSGTTESPGLIPLSIKDCFRYIDEISEEREYLIRLSYLEVYKEHIRDLLASTPQPIRLFENKTDGLVIRGLKEEVVTEPAQVFSLLKEGEGRRQVGATNMNQHSSRSHTLVRLWIESHSAGSASRVSSLTMVDLAGSESVRLNGAARREEGQYINKSLMTLGQVVLSLSEGAKGHIPYRDSKLTRLLQPSLSGNARMVLLCCIHPIASHLEESHNTFKFATRAKRIKQKAVINITADEKTLLQNYRDEIDYLKQQLREAREQQRLLEQRAAGSGNTGTTRNVEEASGEISELVEAIKGMERLILKSRPGDSRPKFRSPERTGADGGLSVDDDSDDHADMSREANNDDLLDDLLADEGIRTSKTVTPTTSPQKDDELQNELHRIRELLGSVLQRRGMSQPTKGGVKNLLPVESATTPSALEEKFDVESSPSSPVALVVGNESMEVQALRQQLIEQEASTSLSKADSSFLQQQLREKDQLLEEVSKILETLEERQTALEQENARLKSQVAALRKERSKI